MQKNPLVEMIAEAQRALPYHTKQRGQDAEPIYIAKKAASLRTLNLKTSFMPQLIADDGSLLAAPMANMAGEKLALDAAIIKASRVAQAGASIIIRPDQTRAIPVGTTGDVALVKQAGHFVTIEAAPFAQVADDADVPASLIPVARAAIDWETAPSVSVRYHMNHTDQKEIGNDQYAAELLASITIGLARAADKLLLAAINSATLSPFTLAAAAAQGIAVHELRGLVGTNGHGAAFRTDGTLAAAGVSAELTGDMAGTVIGAFNRAAIAINSDVSILAERTSAAGALDVTCWASMIALVPDAGKFWNVGA